MPAFFWADCHTDSSAAYEEAAFRALVCLQSIYNFVVVNYNYLNSASYRQLAHILFPIATSGLYGSKSQKHNHHRKHHLLSKVTSLYPIYLSYMPNVCRKEVINQ